MCSMWVSVSTETICTWRLKTSLKCQVSKNISLLLYYNKNQRNAFKRTDLTRYDGRPHHQQHQLVKQRVQEADHRLQLGGVERRDAGLELRLQVVLHDAHVSDPDWKHVLVQGVHQGKELVQVLVLKGGSQIG